MSNKNRMKMGYVAICVYTAEYGCPEFEFVEYFKSRKSAIDYIAESIGREWESNDRLTRNEDAIERSVEELKETGETRSDYGNGNLYVWRLEKVYNS